MTEEIVINRYNSLNPQKEKASLWEAFFIPFHSRIYFLNDIPFSFNASFKTGIAVFPIP